MDFHKYNNNLTILDDTDLNQSSLNLILPPGDVCKSDPTKNYTITQVITCDPTVNGLVIDLPVTFSILSCSNTIRTRSKQGIILSSFLACPDFSVYSFWTVLFANRYILGAILLGIGGFFCFLGNKFIKIVEFFTGVLVVSFVVVYLLFSYLKVQYTSLEFWLILGIAVLLGIIVGYFIAKLEWLAPVILAAFLGYIVGVFLYNIALKYIKSNPTAVFWVTIVVSIAAFAVLGYFLAKHIMVIGTAFIGGYAMMRVLYVFTVGAKLNDWILP